MRVYSRRESNPLKWVLAAILFIVVMTFTMAEVNGYPVSPKPSDGGSASSRATAASVASRRRRPDGRNFSPRLSQMG